jgi:hypothetical protein
MPDITAKNGIESDWLSQPSSVLDLPKIPGAERVPNRGGEQAAQASGHSPRLLPICRKEGIQ